MDSSPDPPPPPPPPQQPQRLSALYQYHNAPEVAPAHGLEYDDSEYPVSDKYPVMHTTFFDRRFRYTGKHAFDDDDTANRPPRIIFGMKLRTFLLVASVMALVIVGASVGGAVGGKNVHTDPDYDVHSPGPDATTPPSSSSTTTTTYTLPTPTYVALTSCPSSNATSYVSTYASGTSGTVPPQAGLNFTTHCDLQSPLAALPSARTIAEAFVYSLADCIEVCAGYNFWNAGANCSAVAYQPAGQRPGNCWVGDAGQVDVAALASAAGWEIAVLNLTAAAS